MQETSSTSSSTRLERYFENALFGFLVADLRTFRIESVNKQFENITGYLKEELEGKSVSLLSPDRSKHTSIKSSRFSEAQVGARGYHEEVVLQKKDGYPAYISMSVSILESETEHVALCIIHDISEKLAMERDLLAKHNELRLAYEELKKTTEDLRKMQEQMVKAGKLAALGELAAGVAHELNQPLTAVRGYAQELCQIVTSSGMKQVPSETVINTANEIIENADRMHRHITHFRKLVRKPPEAWSATNIEETIKSAISLFGRQLAVRNIAVEFKLDDSVPEIISNPPYLEDVFINLITNARDALDESNMQNKKIVISTKRLNLHEIQITFEDNGPGIKPEIIDRIFEPFFTTKNVGKGMGLGLSISHRNITEIGGTLSVASQTGQPGSGTKFFIKLPIERKEIVST